jgi:NAD/NADP transhydrogenase beta subunit
MAAEALKLRNLMSTASAACDANAAEQASSAAATALKRKWQFFMVSSLGYVVAESQRRMPERCHRVIQQGHKIRYTITGCDVMPYGGPFVNK